MFSNWKDLASWYRKPYQFLDKKLKAGEKTFFLNLPGVGEALVTSDPVLLSEIVKNKNLVGGIGTQILDVVVGDHSLITIHGEKHQRHRRILNPFFFQASHDEIADFSKTLILAKINQLRVGQEISVEEFVEEVTLQSIIWYILGAQASEQKRQELYDLVHAWKRTVTNPFFLFVRPLQIPISAKFGWGRFLFLRQKIHNLLLTEIRQGKQPVPLQATKDQEARSFLESFASQGFEAGLSETDILHELVSVLMFGHDTTAIGLGWFIHFAFNNPAYLSQLQNADQSEVYGEWIKAGVMETLRMAPPVVHLTRVATSATKLGPYQLKKGQRVFPCIYMAHHDSANYQDPEKFIPSRFYAKKEPDFRFSYFPFGLGDRVCLGKNMGLKQAQVMAEIFMKHVSGSLVDKKFDPIRKNVLIVPRGGTRFRVEKIRKIARASKDKLASSDSIVSL